MRTRCTGLLGKLTWKEIAALAGVIRTSHSSQYDSTHSMKSKRRNELHLYRDIAAMLTLADFQLVARAPRVCMSGTSRSGLSAMARVAPKPRRRTSTVARPSDLAGTTSWYTL